MSVLRIPKIPQYGVLVEEKFGKEESLFHDVYQGAVKNVYDIINRHQKKTTEISFNPCIAFVGKRGTGKSSAMSSFANFLRKSKSSNLNWIGDKAIQELIYDSSFYMLPAIDTSNMSEKETIIADVSAEMYSEYKKIDDSISVEQKRSFIEATKKANDTAILKSTGDWTKQGDQLLAETNKVVHIQELFKEMTDNFLSIVLKDAHPNKRYLVIQIDDLDMNVANSFSIMEEIRSILSIKNVIVLISVDIEQLKTVLKFHFERSLETKKEGENEKISRDLAYKYIEKLLPVDRRHYMPELSLEQLNTIRAVNFLNEDDADWKKWQLNLNENKKPSVFNAIMHLIWRKTLIIPTKNRFNDYVLIPYNLRSLCNFVVFLRNMEDAAYPTKGLDENKVTPLTYFDFAKEPEGEAYRNVLEHNLNAFKKYLISNIEIHVKPEMTQAEQRISQVLQKIISTLEHTSTDEINNKIVGEIIYALNEEEEKNYFKLINKNNTLTSMLEALHKSYSLGIGDVIYVLREIEEKYRCRYIHYLIEIIRTLWNIRMTKELFIVGCNPKNNRYLESKAKFITPSFRKAIGTIITNPDVEIITYNKDQEISGWQVLKNKRRPSIFDVVIPNNKNYINEEIDQNLFTCDVRCWRTNLRTGEPIYRGDLAGNERHWLSHPMLIFSNLLAPCVRADINDTLREDFFEWQQKYIMPLPFHSINFIQSFVSLLENVNCTKSFPTNKSILYFVLENSLIAIISLWEELCHYIPEVHVSDVNELVQNYPSESENENLYFFGAPITKIKETIRENHELVLVNIALLEFIKTSTKKFEEKREELDNEDRLKFFISLRTLTEAFFSNTNMFFPPEKHEIEIKHFKDFINALMPEEPKKPEDIDNTPYYFHEEAKKIEGVDKHSIIPFYYREEVKHPLKEEIDGILKQVERG